jgi:ABC-type transporter Mla subunit MlaD
MSAADTFNEAEQDVKKQEEDEKEAESIESKVEDQESQTENVEQAVESGKDGSKQELVNEQNQELNEEKQAIEDEEEAEEYAHEAQENIEKTEQQVDQQQKETESFIQNIGGKVEGFKEDLEENNLNGERAGQVAASITGKLVQAKNQLETELKEEQEIVNFEQHEGKDLETLIQEQDSAEKQLGEEFVITERAEEVAQENQDRGLHQAEQQIHEMGVEEIAELAEMDVEAAKNLKHTAQNILHAEKEAEGTKSGLESLQNITADFSRQLEKSDAGMEAANRVMNGADIAAENLGEFANGLNDLMSEVNQFAQEAAQAGQEIAKAGQETGILIQDLAKLGQKGVEVPKKALNITSNVLGVVESATNRINEESNRLEKS